MATSQTLEALSVHDLLVESYKKLVEKLHGDPLKLAEPVLSEVGNDSDHHRSRVGYMRYTEAHLVRTEGTRWAVARGERSGSYPSEHYDSDIVAVKIKNGLLPKRIEPAFRDGVGSYFGHSLMIGMANGLLAYTPKGLYSQHTYRRIASALPRLIDQELEEDRGLLLASTLTPVVKRATSYKPEMADRLADAMREVLYCAE